MSATDSILHVSFIELLNLFGAQSGCLLWPRFLVRISKKAREGMDLAANVWHICLLVVYFRMPAALPKSQVSPLIYLYPGVQRWRVERGILLATDERANQATS